MTWSVSGYDLSLSQEIHAGVWWKRCRKISLKDPPPVLIVVWCCTLEVALRLKSRQYKYYFSPVRRAAAWDVCLYSRGPHLETD